MVAYCFKHVKNIGYFAEFRQVKKITNTFFLTQSLTIVYITSEFNLEKKNNKYFFLTLNY